MKLQRIFFARKVQHPENVDDGEDEPAGGHRLERADARVYPAVDADDCEHDGDGAEDGDLEAVHCDGVRGECVKDADDEEELEEYCEPEWADGCLADCEVGGFAQRREAGEVTQRRTSVTPYGLKHFK